MREWGATTLYIKSIMYPQKTEIANIIWQLNQHWTLKPKVPFIFSLLKSTCNSNSNSTFIALNLCQKTDSKAHHTKTLFNIEKPDTLQGSAPRRKQREIGNLGWVCFSKEVWLQLWLERGKWVCRADLIRKVIPNHRCVIRKTESKMFSRLENWSKVGNLKKYAIRLPSTCVICTMSGNQEGFKVFGVTTV